jgi:hypothetical protein
MHAGRSPSERDLARRLARVVVSALVVTLIVLTILIVRTH